MIVNGFCKEVFKELPMEFAVEATRLLGISLEGALGEEGNSAARGQGTSRRRPGQRDPERCRSLTSRWRSSRDHGPERLGKSTLAQVLAGHPAYTVLAGTATYEGKDLLGMKPEERARAGVFLAFQYPVEIRGITNSYFLRSALNALRRERGEPSSIRSIFSRCSRPS